MSASALPYRIEVFQFSSGMRRAMLVGKDNGMPEWFSTLYVTVKIHNVGKSLAAQESALGAINVLYGHCLDAGIDLVERMRHGKLLDPMECEGLRGASQTKHGPAEKKQSRVVALHTGKRGHLFKMTTVAPATQYVRLGHMAKFLKWLALDVPADGRGASLMQIKGMCNNILELRPLSTCHRDDVDQNTFSTDEMALLTRITTPGAPCNVFQAGVQTRNALLLALLGLLGKRVGEVLGLRLTDIDLVRCQIHIRRRHDAQDDPRKNQPLVKTREHTVPIGPDLAALIDRYLAERRDVPGARKHPYLLVIHKSGPTMGQPMSPGHRMVCPQTEHLSLALLQQIRQDLLMRPRAIDVGCRQCATD